MIHYPAAAPAQHALAVGVVDHRQNAVTVRDLGQLIQRRYIAVHAKHAVGD